MTAINLFFVCPDLYLSRATVVAIVKLFILYQFRLASMCKALALAVIMSVIYSQTGHSATLDISIHDQADAPLAHTVVELIAPQSTLQSITPPSQIQQYSIAQQGLTFVPFVSAIPVGSKVEFPNRDKTRHHIYSFSDAKTFEIELYVGKPKDPVQFNQAGIVVLGCNIHDYMQAYIYIAQSPLVKVTDETGRVQFDDLPEHLYQLKLWHPWQLTPAEPLTVDIRADTQRQFTVPVEHKTLPTPPQRGFGKH